MASDLEIVTIPFPEPDIVHNWFGLTYASYMVLPRSVLQSLPSELQRQLIDAIRAIEDHLSPAYFPAEGGYTVYLRRDNGRFIRDPLRDYERGRRIVTRDDLLRYMGKEPTDADS